MSVDLVLAAGRDVERVEGVVDVRGVEGADGFGRTGSASAGSVEIGKGGVDAFGLLLCGFGAGAFGLGGEGCFFGLE